MTIDIQGKGFVMLIITIVWLAGCRATKMYPSVVAYPQTVQLWIKNPAHHDDLLGIMPAYWSSLPLAGIQVTDDSKLTKLDYVVANTTEADRIINTWACTGLLVKVLRDVDNAGDNTMALADQ